MGILGLIDLVFPPLCVVCGEELLGSERLCAGCWPKVHFLGASNCTKCGERLDGEAEEGSLCDSCLRVSRPWSRGTAAILYQDAGRELVLQFKHRDRLDLLGPMSEWMVSALNRLKLKNSVLIPIPLHPSRLWKRRYNQSALLAQAIAKSAGVHWVGHALLRTKPTPPLGHSSAYERSELLNGAMQLRQTAIQDLQGKHIVLIDDVMASGSTFAEATRALKQVDAASVNVLALARATNNA